ncbi:MAG: type III secretion system translocon subunit SctE [Desulfovibrionaceae bacterium]|jgi:Mg2+ and Co2+ transporter CorA|nr:type III secretion system translocon subunit SctE [Desulfovibrionaceae bacterium]
MSNGVGGVGSGQTPQIYGSDAPDQLNQKVMGSLENYIKVLQEKGGELQEAQDKVRQELEKPGLDKTELLAALLEARNKLAELMKSFGVENIRADQVQKQAAIDEKLEKIHEAIKKMQESKKSGLFMKIFGWVVAGIMLIAAVAATIATGGSAAPLLVAAIFSIGMMILDETGASDKIAEGIGKVFEAMGVDEKTAKIIGHVVLIAVVLAVDITCMILSAGASTANAANTLTKLTKMSVETAEKVVKVSNYVNQIAKAAGGLAMLGQAGATVDNTVKNKQAADAQADAMTMEKYIQQIQQLIDDAIDQLDEIIEALLKDTGTVMKALDANTNTRMKMGQAMA